MLLDIQYRAPTLYHPSMSVAFCMPCPALCHWTPCQPLSSSPPTPPPFLPPYSCGLPSCLAYPFPPYTHRIPTQALLFLGAQLGVGLSILLQLNSAAQVLGASSLVLVGAYPAMKRITWWPQAFLGGLGGGGRAGEQG